MQHNPKDLMRFRKNDPFDPCDLLMTFDPVIDHSDQVSLNSVERVRRLIRLFG